MHLVNYLTNEKTSEKSKILFRNLLTKKQFGSIIKMFQGERKKRKGDKKMDKKIQEMARVQAMEIVRKAFSEAGYEVLQVGSGSFAIPFVIEGEEGYYKIPIQIPKGSRDGEAFDGYAEAENYKTESEEKAKKKADSAAKKAAKIERDKAMREAKKKQKEEKEGE